MEYCSESRQQLRQRAAPMVNVDRCLVGLLNLLRDKALGMPVRELLGWVNCGGEMHPESG